MTEVATRGPNEALVGVQGSRSQLSTPALVLDLDRVEANIGALAAHAAAHGYALRPVVKIHKSVQVAQMQMEAGAIGVGCSTIAEAETMVAGGITDVFLFTSVVTESKLERLASVNAAAGGIVVAADHAENIKQLAEAARRSGTTMRVLVDVEVGDHRTGVADPAIAVSLAQLITEIDGLAYAGVQGYCGTHQVMPDYDERRRRGVVVLDRLAEFVDALDAAGLPPGIVSGGGTGTHDFDHERGLLTEVQAGSYVVLDGNYADVPLRRDDPHPFAPALTVRGTVISNAQPGFVITDAGAKEIDGIFMPTLPRVLSGAPAESKYVIVGDDMGRIELPAGAASPVAGTSVELLPPHCYQTVIMYSNYHCVRGDTLVDIWPIDAVPTW
jgi:D-serine deaminase-like pyridoxal phosphate-dependent protein